LARARRDTLESSAARASFAADASESWPRRGGGASARVGDFRMEQGAVRNLEQIQEADDGPRTPRAVTIALVLLCGACVTFGAVALKGRKTPSEAAKTDPLGALVAAQKGAGGGKATDLTTKDVTFPAILSDEQSPTTALAAVKGAPK